MWESFASGVGKITNSIGDTLQNTTNTLNNTINNTPSLFIWGIIPCIIFYITLLLLIHFGLDYSLLNNCKINNKNEKKCYNKTIYYSLYLLVPLIISSILSYLFYYLIFIVKNPNIVGMKITQSILF